MITSAASASDLGPLQPDQVVALHYLVQAAGEPAHCGWVYRALDQRTQQPVIIKCLPQPLSPQARAYFAQVQRCRSRVLLPILEISEPADQLPMLIIEAATGRRLDQLLAEGARLQPAQAFQLGRDLALTSYKPRGRCPFPSSCWPRRTFTSLSLSWAMPCWWTTSASPRITTMRRARSAKG